MKKIYTLTLFVLAFMLNINTQAQITLTKAANEPIIGNIDYRQSMDTVNTIPNNVGSGQLWDFSTITTGTASVTEITYTTVSSVPEGTAHPTATLAQTNGTAPSFFKSSGSSFEMLGTKISSVTLNFSNTAVIANWPISFNYSNNDPVSGNILTSFGNGTFSGNIVGTAPGTGTLLLPGGRTYTNVLQVITYLNINAAITVSMFPVTATVNAVNYQYYDASQKFPILNVSITKLKSALLNQDDITLDVNNSIYAGINEYTLENSLSIFPNPASNFVSVSFNSNEPAVIEIMNQLGQHVRSEKVNSQATHIDISTLPSGIYFVKTTVANKISVKKLIKD